MCRIFIVDDFIGEEDCKLLIAKAEKTLKPDEFNTFSVDGEDKGGTRTSKRSMTRDEEVRPRK